MTYCAHVAWCCAEAAEAAAAAAAAEKRKRGEQGHFAGLFQKGYFVAGLFCSIFAGLFFRAILLDI